MVSAIPNRIGLPFLLRVIEVRSLTPLAAKTPRSRRATKSQLGSSLPTDKLNSARSRAQPAISRRTRIDQTCLGRSGRFRQMTRPLLQGARTGRRTGSRSTDMGLTPFLRANLLRSYQRRQDITHLKCGLIASRRRSVVAGVQDRVFAVLARTTGGLNPGACNIIMISRTPVRPHRRPRGRSTSGKSIV